MQIKGHSRLDRHFDIILIKRHFFAPKVPFSRLFEAKMGKIQICTPPLKKPQTFIERRAFNNVDTVFGMLELVTL